MANYIVPSYTDEEWRERFIAAHNRAVFSLDSNSVIKFGCPSLGMSGGQNVTEAAMWKGKIQHKKRDKFLFAGVEDVAPDGSWLVMERADGIVFLTKKEEQRFKNLAERYDIPIEELRMANFGFHYATGKTVLRDYGIDYYNGYKDTVVSCGQCTFCHFVDVFPDIIEVETSRERSR